MARVFVNIGPLRRNAPFRHLWLGQLISSMGSQLTVVAVAYQTYRITRSTLMVGLVSLVQLVPLIVGSIGGGAVADSRDRRRVLIATQLMMAAASGGLVVNSLTGHPTMWPLFACTAASALFSGTDFPARRAAIPMLVAAEDLTDAIAVQSVLQQWSLVAGPSLAGLLIARIGLASVYGIDVATFAAALIAVLSLPSLVPASGGARVTLKSIAEGFSFLRGKRFVASTFWIDLNAMVFGMPRAVFPALGIDLFRGGAGTVGLLYAAPGAGALAGSLLTGWVAKVRHQGRAVVVCVAAWGAAIAAFGFVPILGVALALLALAGAADAISAVFRVAILQTNVPESLQGRLAGVLSAVVTGGPRLGDGETGAVSALGGPRLAVWSGGLACVAGVGVLLALIPEMWRDSSGGGLTQVQREQIATEAAGETSAELGESGMA